MREVIVTGANGFIGRNLIRRLVKEDCKIFAVYRTVEHQMFSNEEAVANIVCPLEQIDRLNSVINKADVFFHFAWEGSTGELRGDYATQLSNAKYVCDAARVAKSLGVNRFISTGTITERIVPYSIKNNYLSQNLAYAIAKDTAHRMLALLCNREDIDFCWVQLSNIFGGDNTNGNLISYTIDSFKKNEVPEYGPCDQPYDFLYIKDAIEGIIKIGFADKCSNEYFVGSDRPRILKEYIESIARRFDAKVGIGMRPSDGVIYKAAWFDSKKLRDELGFNPYYTFEAAVDEMVKRVYKECSNLSLQNLI